MNKDDILKAIDEFMFVTGNEEKIVKIINSYPKLITEIVFDKNVNSELRANAVRIIIKSFPDDNELLMKLLKFLSIVNESIIQYGIYLGLIERYER